jgi:hypothetical protein
MSNKLPEDFYPVTPSAARNLRKANLTASEWKIWSYLVEVDPWGDRYHEVETLELMQACDVSKATYYRAIAKFQEAKIFDFQDKGFNVRNLNGIGKIKSEKVVSEMRQTDKISDSQDCENSLKNEKTVSEMRQLSQNCENRGSKVAPSKDSGTPQIYSDQLDKLDRSDLNDFSNFSESNPENSGAQKCDLTPVNEVIESKTPTKVITTIEANSPRREIENFVISKLNLEFTSPEKRKAYFDKFTTEHWDKWKFQMKPTVSRPIDRRDPVAEDPFRVENAIASMVRCKDFDAAENRLSLVEKTNPVLANQLREKYLCS